MTKDKRPRWAGLKRSSVIVFLFGRLSVSTATATAPTLAASEITPDQAPVAGTENASAAAADSQLLRLNFRGVPLDTILDYLSDAAGFVIEKHTQLSGTVEIWSKSPVTPAEAVTLLDAALNKSGYAVMRHGRVLTILREDEAKTADLEIQTGNDPAAVERSDELVTQLIPVRHASATQLVANLQLLLRAGTTLSVNESANTLILVARKSDVHRMLQIIQALDTSLTSQSSLRIFALRNGEAKAIAATVQQLFASSSASQTSANGAAVGPGFNFPGGGGFGPTGMPGLPGDAGTASQTGGGSALGAVVAIADDRSNSVIVSAPEGSLTLIASVIRQLDEPAADLKELRVFRLANADPTELANQLAQLFPDTSGSSTDQNQMPFFPGPPGISANSGSDADSSGSSRKLAVGKVLAVADPRTSSLLVTAAKGLMPQIVKLVKDLDSSAARKELVGIWELKNADPQDVNQILKTLFSRNSVASNTSNDRNSLLGSSNPLTARQTQQQSASSSTLSLGGGNSGQSGGAAGTPGSVP